MDDRIKKLPQRLKYHLVERYTKIKLSPVAKFSCVVIFFELIYWVIMIFTRSAWLTSYFVDDQFDTSMDYFNMLANLWKGNPYKAYANYPPLVFLILRGLYHMVPLLPEGGDGKFLRNFEPAQLGYTLVLLFCVITIYELSQLGLNGKNKIECKLFAIAIILSGPFLFAIERGNFIILSFVFLLIYLETYDNENISIRVLSYIALAISASIKIYPAVFGLLIIDKKRYKEVGTAILIGILSFFGPFLFFKGFTDLKRMIQGIGLSGDIANAVGTGYNFSLANLFRIVGVLFGEEIELNTYLILVIAIIVPLFIFIFSQEEWEKLFALGLMCIWVPQFSYTYSLLFLIPSVINYFNHINSLPSKRNHIFEFYFGVLIVPLALPLLQKNTDIKFALSWSTFAINTIIVAIVVSLICRIVRNYIKIIKK